jgi:3-oxoacyl-(acyl-carrier-protein) synthase
MIAFAVQAVGLLAPGLPGWQPSRPVLRREAPYRPADLPPPKPTLLPAGERRRTTALARLALAAAEEAMATTAIDATTLTSIFASSSGDMEIFNRICQVLLEADRPVSPTHFHNSVHNAPAGYWAIATGNMRNSVSLSAFDGTFGAGLQEAATIVAGDAAPVLLVAYDGPAPVPLLAKRPVPVGFAVALLCAPLADDRPLARLVVLSRATEGESEISDPNLEALRVSNPAARSLPLLQAIAGGAPSRVNLPAGSGLLTVEVNR